MGEKGKRERKGDDRLFHFFAVRLAEYLLVVVSRGVVVAAEVDAGLDPVEGPMSWSEFCAMMR